MRLYIADTRTLTDDDNPWLEHEHAHLVAPLLVKSFQAFADLMEYVLDTHPATEAYEVIKGLLHSVESTVPMPFDAEVWPCQCNDPHAPGHAPMLVNHFEERRLSRLRASFAGVNLPTEPIAIVA